MARVLERLAVSLKTRDEEEHEKQSDSSSDATKSSGELESSVTPSLTESPAKLVVISYKTSALPEAYAPMIYARWLRSLWKGNATFHKVSKHTYYENYPKFINNLLDKPDSLVRLAVLSDDHDVVLGFSISREDVLDYVHVHTDYRRLGIARLLLPSGTTTFSHITATAIAIWQGNPKYKHLKFNPFA